MKFVQIVLLIAVALAAFYYFKPVEFNQYVYNPTMSVVNPIIHPSSNNNAATQTNQTAVTVPDVLGKALSPYDCKTTADCQKSYPAYATKVFCNNGTGDCELPKGSTI